MSGVRKGKQVVGLFAADLHFSELKPQARADENWLRTQERYVGQLVALQDQYRVPLLLAGDIFDRWNSSAALINKVLAWFEPLEAFAIPGNHDLPNHSYRDADKSAYWTLVEAKAITNLIPGLTHEIGTLSVQAFPHGFPVKPMTKVTSSLTLNVALIHDYIYTSTTGRPDAPEDNRYAAWLPKLKGYAVAAFGDNHKSLLQQAPGRTTVFNPGSFIRRHSDEIEHKPCVGKLLSDGTMERHYLNTEVDQFENHTKTQSQLEAGLLADLEGFADELSRLHAEKMEFSKVVGMCLAKNKDTIPEPVKQILLRSVGAI
jgi:DNA repair exonuclease SbcCD nuclease subunit